MSEKEKRKIFVFGSKNVTVLPDVVVNAVKSKGSKSNIEDLTKQNKPYVVFIVRRADR